MPGSSRPFETRWRFFLALGRSVPQGPKILLRRLAFRMWDVLSLVFGRRVWWLLDWLPFSGCGPFRSVGEGYVRLFISLGQLRPDEAVLDVGCGIGRVAMPLARYLDPARGRYVGFDIEPEPVRWCARNIAKRHPNFTFLHLPVGNRNYAAYAARADEARFPFPDGSFGFVIATSVFTHMAPADVRNYIGEVARVMAEGARFFVTLFLLNAESESLIREGKSRYDFHFDAGGCKTINPRLPETAIAYEESRVREWLEAAGLSILSMVPGDWCGPASAQGGQDLVVAVKRDNVLRPQPSGRE